MTLAADVRRWAASTAAHSATVPYAGALVLVLMAPFELIRPVVVLPVQVLTTVELVMLTVLASWLLWSVVTGDQPTGRTPLTLPAVLLLATMLVSAWFAPDPQPEALDFTARFAAGLLVYLLIVNTARTRARLVGLIAAAAVAGTIVASIGLLEYRQVPAVVDRLGLFRVGEFLVGGQLRITSTLSYPTITSMYLEFTFGLTLALLLLAVARRRWWVAGATFAALGLMIEAIILTLSRSGLVVVAAMLGLAGVLWLWRVGANRGFWILGALGALLVAFLAYRVLSDSMLWLRLTTENDTEWYRATYSVPERLELAPGETRQVPVTLTNTGRVTWTTDGQAPFMLAYHWLDVNSDDIVVFEGVRTPLPGPVRPDQTVQLAATVQAPPEPGQYRLAWDVVQEHRLWFSLKGSPSADSLAVVEGSPTGTLEPFEVEEVKPVRVLGRRELWRLAGRMLASHPFLGVGPDSFRLTYGSYLELDDWDKGLHTNNMYIEFFVDTGLIGGVLFLWLIWRVLTTLYRTLARISDNWLAILAGVAAAVLGFLIHGVVDYFFEFTPTYLMIWFVLGLTVALARLSGVADAHRL